MAEVFNPMEWITTKEAAELTGYSSVTLAKAAACRYLQTVRPTTPFWLRPISLFGRFRAAVQARLPR